MTDHRPLYRQRALALPGKFDAITLQANVTLRPQQQTMRWTIASRDPKTHTMMSTCQNGPLPYAFALEPLRGDLDREIGFLLYLAGFDAVSAGTPLPGTDGAAVLDQLQPADYQATRRETIKSTGGIFPE